MDWFKGKGPDYLIQLSRGYWLSQTLFVALRIGVFELLSKGPLKGEEIAAQLQLDPTNSTIFLDALTSLGLLNRVNGQYDNTQISNQYLVKGRESYLGDFISHTEYMQCYWEKLVSVLKSGKPALSTTNSQPDHNQASLFIKAMDQACSSVAAEIADSLNLEGKTHLLDIGAGLATISRRLLNKYPQLAITLYDLPHIIALVKDNLLKPNERNRLFFKEGDCRYDDYGERIYDTILLSNVIHMYDLEVNSTIFTRAYKALKPQGWLILHDYILADDYPSPWQGALFSLNMLVGTWGGRNYTWKEVRTRLETIGFSGLQVKLLQGGTSLVIATK
jgi:predicted transcriptional regulator